MIQNLGPAPTAFHHSPHGDLTHNFAIMLLKNKMVKTNLSGGKVTYRFLDDRAFKDKANSPAIPDIYVRRVEQGTDSRGKKTVADLQEVFEVESHATPQSIARKWDHFKESVTGIELQVINLEDYPGLDGLAEIAKFDTWLERYL